MINYIHPKVSSIMTLPVSTTFLIVTDPIGLYYGKNPIECEVNSFLHGVFGDSIECEEIITISYLLNIIEVKNDRARQKKEWRFLPENIERVKTILEGVTVEQNSFLHLTTYDSILSILLVIVAKVVNKIILTEQY